MSENNDSRIEKLLKAILGQEVQLEPRESRVERLLYAILTGGSHDEPTLSEMEDILLCILNGERYDGPTNSRINALLKVKANGGDYDEPRLSRIEDLIYEWINGGDVSTYTGALPATLQTVAGYLLRYKIWGSTGGVGLKTEQLFSAVNSEGGYLDTDGNVVSPQHVNFRHTDFLPLPLDANDITVAYEGPSGTGMNAPALCFYDVAKTYLSGESYEGARTKTFAIPENARYFRTSYRSTMTVVNIVAGSTPATSDIPYGYKLPILSNDATTDIYIGDTQLAKDEYVDSSTGKIYKWADITGLSEPLCGIDTYTDSLDLSTGVLMRRIKKLVLTGGTDEIYAYDSSFTRFYFVIADMLGNGVRLTPLYCTHYRNISDGRPIGDVPNNSIYTGDGVTMNTAYIKTTDYTSVTDFKSYLAAQYAAGTPVTVWYVLAEPETSTVSVPSGLTGTIEGYLIQDGTPTPENPIVPSGCGERTGNLFSGEYSQFNNVGGTGNTYAYFYVPEDFTLTLIAKDTHTVPTSVYLGITNDGGQPTGGYTWAIAQRLNVTEGSIFTVESSIDGYHCVSMYRQADSTLSWILDHYYIMLNLGSDPLPYEPYGYKLPILTPTDPPVPLPQIPTAEGETTIDYGAAALPHVTGLDGIFEYGNIDGLTWKNSVSGENDITFDTAVTDTGAEYVLPTGASGQYTSKSGEYRTAFTWYCVAKCPTTCYAAGQYMISNLGNGIGVEISSGWTAYTSIGGNHLVRGVDNRDYNSQMPVTDYALIAVAGDVNGTASIFVNGEKTTDSWNFNPAPSDRAATVYLGKRASGQLSGTDIDYKFLAFGTTKQTDAEIAANSQYLMTKYLGVGRPEKVELKYK